MQQMGSTEGDVSRAVAATLPPHLSAEPSRVALNGLPAEWWGGDVDSYIGVPVPSHGWAWGQLTLLRV